MNSLNSSATTVAEGRPSFERPSLKRGSISGHPDVHVMPEMPQNPKTDDLEKLPSQPGAHDPKSFPDGGWEAWLVVSGAFCVMFCSFGWVNCKQAPVSSLVGTDGMKGIGVFQAYYQTNQLKHLSPSTVSWITSLEVFTMFVGVC
jgi:hypothetical protein